ncbi:MAG: hypothetical protein ACI4EF_01905 [Coprococcus sp.]
MNKRYFLRGLGIGLIIGGIVMFVAFQTYKPSESGSVDKSLIVAEDKDSSEDNTEKVTSEEKVTTAEATTEKTTEKATEEVNKTDKTSEEKTTESKDSEKTTSDNDVTEKTTEEKTTEKDSTEKATTEKSTTEEKTEKVTTEKATEEVTTEAPKPEAVKNSSGVGGYITIVEGMNALDICEALETIGVVSDKWDYYNWLLQSGYSESLMQGTYYFTGNESYAGIVWILLGNQ